MNAVHDPVETVKLHYLCYHDTIFTINRVYKIQEKRQGISHKETHASHVLEAFTPIVATNKTKKSMGGGITNFFEVKVKWIHKWMLIQ